MKSKQKILREVVENEGITWKEVEDTYLVGIIWKAMEKYHRQFKKKKTK